MADAVARYNLARWKALAQADALWTRPWLDLDAASARRQIDRHDRLGDVKGKRVLCLASGGGQQAAAFAVLGAQVTVCDLSDEQLARDRLASAHYRIPIETVQGDMRDLSALEAGAFDIVWHPYALNFVPDPRVVFRQVARVLRAGGRYIVQCANPFVSGIGAGDWNGEGYVLKHAYGAEDALTSADQAWVAKSLEGIPPPREYRHALSTLVNGLVAQGFVIRHVSDCADFDADPHAPPGTWAHLISIVPPWLTFWSDYAGAPVSA